MNIVDDLLELFGVKAPAFAEVIGAPYATVHSWRANNRIPRWRHAQIVQAADKSGVCVTDVESALSKIEQGNAA